MSKYKKKYKWLRLLNLYTGNVIDNDDYDAMDDMPIGWEIAFGEELCEELDEAIKSAGLEDTFVVDQVKEKYGQLRFYVSNHTKELSDIIEKYSALSENICIECGKPDVPMIGTSWISPFCKDCFLKLYDQWTEDDYHRLAISTHRMKNKLVFHTLSKDGGDSTYELDCSQTANAIRIKYRSRTSAN